ncbi:MAG: TIGR04282 family arsenosugar biosynthesis glycosyltransferase [Pseudooceanicola sp.]
MPNPRASSRRPHLIVLVKEPRAGRAKTRLGRDIGMTAAAWWMRHQIRRLLRDLRDPRWTITLCVAPDRATMSRTWPGDLARYPQGGGDLGTRMIRALRDAPAGPVCLIGADIPHLTPVHIARAFRAIGPADVVFGPATDGGYWLVGLRHGGQVPAGIFDNVRWSSQHTLADTLANLRDHSVALTDQMSDVDVAADLPV